MKPVLGAGRFRPWYAGLRQANGGGPPYFDPDSLLTGITNSFWTDLLQSGVLYQDVNLDTPAVATNDPIGGVRNLSKIGTATLGQSTTGDKFKLAADGRMERDGTVGSQRLESNISMNLTNGFCFAFTATLGNPSAIFSGGASLALRIQRSGLRLQTTFGDTTVSESFVFS